MNATPSALAARVRATPPRCGATRLVCIDGRSAAGKTELAARLATDLGDAPTLHMDDLYPGWDGLAAAVPLLVESVIEPLAAGRAARHPRWDWARSAYRTVVEIGTPPLLVVEGVGCGARPIAAHAVLLVWVEAAADVRYRRAMARDGEAFRPHWHRWARQEALHFAAERTRDRADLILLTDAQR